MQLLDTVAPNEDMPSKGLRRGDVGAVVEVYEPDELEVEFVTGTGKTRALVTLKTAEVRPLDETDVLAVRLLDAA